MMKDLNIWIPHSFEAVGWNILDSNPHHNKSEAGRYCEGILEEAFPCASGFGPGCDTGDW